MLNPGGAYLILFELVGGLLCGPEVQSEADGPQLAVHVPEPLLQTAHLVGDVCQRSGRCRRRQMEIGNIKQ